MKRIVLIVVIFISFSCASHAGKKNCPAKTEFKKGIQDEKELKQELSNMMKDLVMSITVQPTDYPSEIYEYIDNKYVKKIVKNKKESRDLCDGEPSTAEPFESNIETIRQYITNYKYLKNAENMNNMGGFVGVVNAIIITVNSKTKGVCQPIYFCRIKEINKKNNVEFCNALAEKGRRNHAFGF